MNHIHHIIISYSFDLGFFFDGERERERFERSKNVKSSQESMRHNVCSALSRLRDILSLDGDIDVDLYDENFDDVESLDSILNRRTFRMYLESRMRRNDQTTIDVPTKEDTTEKETKG